MTSETDETYVGTAVTDYGHMTIVVPPLTDTELNTIEWGGVVDSQDVANFDEGEVPFTAIEVKVDESVIPTKEIFLRARDHVGKIATAVAVVRHGYLRQTLRPIILISDPVTDEASESFFDLGRMLKTLYY